MKRYPVEPLVAFSGLGLDEFRRRLSISGTTWVDVRENGVSPDRADRWAVKLGVDAYVVWPEMLDDVIQEASRECAAPDCTETFVPAFPERRKRLYCSRRCKSRISKRRSRSTPEGRAKANAAREAYRQDVLASEAGRRALRAANRRATQAYRERLRAKAQEEAIAS